MTVADNLAFPLRMRKLPAATIRDRVARGLALVQLDGLGARYPATSRAGSSSGWRWRAPSSSAAGAADDGAAGTLDKQLRLEMQLELKHLQARLGVTVIYVTHDQERRSRSADRIAVMNRGPDRADLGAGEL